MREDIRKRIEDAQRRRAERKAGIKRAPIEPPRITHEPPPPNSVLLQIPEWVLHLGLDDPTAQYRVYGTDGNAIFESNAGPQTWALICPYDEIVIGGRRGGGKSFCLKGWMSVGDLTLDDDDPARSSYLLDPSFRGLFLREEYQAMMDFIDEAVEYYKPLGGKATGGANKPVIITFPSGAKIDFNHLGNEDAFEKYRGRNLTRIGIEELTQIKTLKRYLKLLGSLRSVERVRGSKRFPALRTQIMSTTNPDGPGANWIINRFIDVPGRGGKFIPWGTPMRDPRTDLTRIFIPFPREANPYLGENTAAGRKYTAMLMAQDDVTKAQWMWGDWHAGSSKYFSEYRPLGPIGEEEKDHYPWACHVTSGVRLQPWWFRWGSGDWGYDHPSAFHKYVINGDDQRVHVYDELQVRHVGSFELGALLAKWWMPELVALQRAGRDPNITIHLGSDAFAHSDETKTIAELMAAGIQHVLGPFGALLLKYNEDENEVMMRDPKRAKMLFERRKSELQGHMFIALKPVYVDRVKAWAHLREWLRFRPAILQLQTEEQRDEYLRAVLAEQGSVAYELQLAELKNIKPEILPKVQFWSHCTEIDRCLKSAQRDTSADGDPSRQSKREDVLKFNADDEGKNGDDALESVRNGCLAFQDIKVEIPREYWVSEQVEAAKKQFIEDYGEPITDPTRLAMIAMKQDALYKRDHSDNLKAFTPARAGTPSRFVN
jgi:hypothetical protein